MISQQTVFELIPTALQDRFRSDTQIASRAITVVGEFAEWFDQSGLPFFRHYTDHTTKHSLDVFRTAMELIPDTAYDVITAADIAALLVASFAHDAGMHLTEDQFLALISDDMAPTGDFDSASWAVLWHDFMKEARRFNQALLESIFGDTEAVRDLPANSIDFTNRDRLLVGEFLRRNHPRLAHDIVVRLANKLGLPDLCRALSKTEQDLIGLISRSHGMNVRDTFTYIEDNFDKRTFQNIHVIYVIILIRISDYAQIQSARAPSIHKKIHNVPSPLSQREWRVHQSVVNIHQSHDDPEAIYVDARPESVEDLTRVRDWLLDLQRELDLSWAIIGEIFGRHSVPALNSLGLKLRRVRSTVLDGTRKYPFLPKAYSFKVAEAEMLSLLLAPLYGDHPLYGVRELVQNARDAIIERGSSSPTAPHIVQVTIDSRPQLQSVTILDSGIGMTPQVIGEYFLNAGASYRHSQEWKSKNIDDTGKSRVSRSGRFGVGALAAFLVGDRINVKTRHISSGEGLQFECRLHDKAIEIREVSADIGTEIVAHSDEKTIQRLIKSLPAWKNLFEFNDIEFEVYVIDKLGMKNKLDLTSSPKKSKGFTFNFSTKIFPNIRCSIYGSSGQGLRQGRDHVNGIAISNLSREDQLGFGSSIYESRQLTNPVSFPEPSYYGGTNVALQISIKIEDKNSGYPVNLSRTSCTSKDTEVTERIDAELYRKYLEEISFYNKKIHEEKENSRKSPIVSGFFNVNVSNILFFNGNVIINDKSLLKSSGVRYACRLHEIQRRRIFLLQYFHIIAD